MKTNKRKLQAIALLVGFLLAAPAAHVLAGDAFDWSRYVPLDDDVLISATTWNESDDGVISPSTEVAVQRGPLVGGTFLVSASVKTERDDLTGVRFLVADDDDEDGTIEAGEWVELARATASVTTTGTQAVTRTVTVSAFRDAYRVEHTWRDFGVSYDEVVRVGLEVE